jgi:ribokinase
MAKVIGPGSCNVDLTGYANHLPVAGETAVGDLIRTSPGGKGSNQMVAAHMSGSDALLIARIGDDALANCLHDFYAVKGFGKKHIKISEGENTGTAIIEIDKTDAQNRILIIRGANMLLSEADVLGAEGDFVDCDVVLTQLETLDEPIYAAARLAKKYNKPFILNPAPYRPLDAELLSMVDYITPNETEASYLTGIEINSIDDAKNAAKKLLNMGIKNVIITLGVNGAYYTDGDKEIHVKGIKVKAVETTGAGDAFNGGFATALGEGMDIEKALKFANCTAAISVTRLGAAESMPTRSEIDELIIEKYHM